MWCLSGEDGQDLQQLHLPAKRLKGTHSHLQVQNHLEVWRMFISPHKRYLNNNHGLDLWEILTMHEVSNRGGMITIFICVGRREGRHSFQLALPPW